MDYLGEWLENRSEIYHAVTKNMEPEVLDVRLKDIGYMAFGNQFTFLGLNLLNRKLGIILPVPVLPISQY